MESLFSPNAIAALVTLVVMEVVLGIDNIIFISVMAGRLPASKQKKARSLGLMAAMFSRIALLFSITLVMRLNKPLIALGGILLTGRDLVLLVGGLFLMWKATKEIHEKVEGDEEEAAGQRRTPATMRSVILQILVIDIIFSLDSVVTAVGMADDIRIMVAAVVISVAVMMLAAGSISKFVEQRPTIKMLALAFLLMIGVMLVAESFHVHVPKGYIYFAMAFSIGVEMLNIRMHKKGKAIR